MKRKYVREKQVHEIDVQLILKKKGWFVREGQSSGHHLWNRLSMWQWFIQLCGWIYAIKAFAMVFLVDDNSEWNHYLGDISPIIGE